MPWVWVLLLQEQPGGSVGWPGRMSWRSWATSVRPEKHALVWDVALANSFRLRNLEIEIWLALQYHPLQCAVKVWLEFHHPCCLNLVVNHLRGQSCGPSGVAFLDWSWDAALVAAVLSYPALWPSDRPRVKEGILGEGHLVTPKGTTVLPSCRPVFFLLPFVKVSWSSAASD